MSAAPNPDFVPMTPRQRRYIMAQAREIGLSRGERLELAEFLLRRDLATMKYLTHDEAAKLIDALNGYRLVSHILANRAPSVTDDTAPDS